MRAVGVPCGSSLPRLASGPWVGLHASVAARTGIVFVLSRRGRYAFGEQRLRCASLWCGVPALRVLLVDDSPATRAFLRAALETALGPETELVEASGGFEAFRLLPRGPYDVVITDINMPDINGL